MKLLLLFALFLGACTVAQVNQVAQGEPTGYAVLLGCALLVLVVWRKPRAA